MMRCLLALAALLAVSAALPQQPVSGGDGGQPPATPPPAPPAVPASAPASAPPGAPQKASSDQNATIIKNDAQIDANGNFNYSYELSNGIKVEQSGQQVPKEQDVESRSGAENTTEQEQVVSGSYSYVAPDGRTISVRYCADASGYNANVTIGKTLDELPRVNCTALALEHRRRRVLAGRATTPPQPPTDTSTTTTSQTPPTVTTTTTPTPSVAAITTTQTSPTVTTTPLTSPTTQVSQTTPTVEGE